MNWTLSESSYNRNQVTLVFLSSWDWLLSLSIVSSRFTLIASPCRISSHPNSSHRFCKKWPQDHGCALECSHQWCSLLLKKKTEKYVDFAGSLGQLVYGILRSIGAGPNRSRAKWSLMNPRHSCLFEPLSTKKLMFKIVSLYGMNRGFPCGISGKESACQSRRCKRHGFDPWVGKIPWSRKWQPIPIFLPGEFLGQQSLGVYSSQGREERDTTEHPPTITE